MINTIETITSVINKYQRHDRSTDIRYDVVLNCDCMDMMRALPDRSIDIIIADPPYGIKADENHNNLSGKKGFNKQSGTYKKYHNTNWDENIPHKSYFTELQRISQNQIIWGGNYFTEYLKPSSGWIVWNKKSDIKERLSMCELAWSSFNIKCNRFDFLWAGFKKEIQEARFHPTQKPVALYRWLLQNYAKPGDKIIDTHSGSGSCAIACYLEKFDFLAIEKDEDYYKASVERLDTLRSQGVLF